MQYSLNTYSYRTEDTIDHEEVKLCIYGDWLPLAKYKIMLLLVFSLKIDESIRVLHMKAASVALLPYIVS